MILYVLKAEEYEETFEMFPQIRKQWESAAKEKRHIHKKKITDIEKKFPVYGIGPNLSEQAIAKLQNYGMKNKPNKKAFASHSKYI